MPRCPSGARVGAMAAGHRAGGVRVAARTGAARSRRRPQHPASRSRRSRGARCRSPRPQARRPAGDSRPAAGIVGRCPRIVVPPGALYVCVAGPGAHPVQTAIEYAEKVDALVPQASGDGTVPIRAQRVPPQRRPRLRRGRHRNHAGDRSRIRQEGAARPVQGELTRCRADLACARVGRRRDVAARRMRGASAASSCFTSPLIAPPSATISRP